MKYENKSKKELIEELLKLNIENSNLNKKISFLESENHENKQNITIKNKFEKIINTDFSVIICLDLDFKIIEFNSIAENLFGIKQKAVIGKNYLDLFIPEKYQQEIIKDIKKVLKGIPTKGFANEIISKDKSVHFLKWNVDSLLDSEGNAYGIAAIGQDLTEQRKIEEKLNIERDKIESLMNGLSATGIGIDIVGTDYNVRYQNKTLYDRFSDLTGKKCYQNYMGLDNPCDFCPMEEAIKNRRVEMTALKAPDEHTYQLISAPIINEDGSIDSVSEVVIDITDRLELNKKVVESEYKYYKLFESANDGIFLMKDYKFIECNTRTLNMFGCREKSEIIGKTPADFSPEKQPDGEFSLQKAVKKLNDALSGIPQSFEWKHKKISGQLFDVEVSLNKVELSGKVYIMAIVRDVTEKKLGEEKILNEKRMTDAVINSLPGIFFIYEEGERLVRWNKNVETVTKYSYKELLNRHPLEWFDEEGKKNFQKGFDQLIKTGSSSNESELIIKTKEKIPFYFTGTLLKIENINYLLGFGIDISELKKSREELDRVQKLLQASIEQSPSGIIIANAPDADIILANQTALGIRNNSDNKLVNIPVDKHSINWQTYHLDGRLYDSKDLPLSRAIFKGETVNNIEIIIKRENNEKRWVSVNAAPIKNEKDEIIAGIVIFHDITDMKIAEKEKEEHNQIIMQTQKLKALGELAAGMAHEINQPLSGISMAVDNILLKDKNSISQSDYLEKKLNNILEYVERIKNIIDHVRVFSRDQKGKIYNKININNSVENALSLINTQYKIHEINITTKLQKDIPLILGNIYRFEQVILNLLSNSRDALEEKKKSADAEYLMNIILKTYAVNNLVCFEIEDNGIGILESKISSIFDPFFTTKSVDKGTGLGLSISYGIIKEMSGEISIESKINQYTKFFIYFPIPEEKYE